MKTTASNDVRKAFLGYFEERGHTIVRSSSLVPAGDATLLFTNAGMNQFKKVFLGQESRDDRRAVSSQKCLRVSGKHNDLEQVGRTPRHHTFFEMLGNFSFGDYFKEEAIEFAWDLLTVRFALPKEKLWVTVFAGEPGLEADTEAGKIWTSRFGIPAERFRRYGASDNFWSMGETGPCGPCSEIHWDHGPKTGCGRAECEPSCPCGRFVELWNLVFMQFERAASGELKPLPRPNIDTGMGLERICSVLQGVGSNYETDLFRPLISAVEQLSGRPYGGSESDVSMQVIADHLRAMSFLAADGVVPANDKRGYVLRRLLRRAILHGQRLGLADPFLHDLSGLVVDRMGGAYPELIESRDLIRGVLLREEEQFARTLSKGVALLREVIEKTRASGAGVLPGPDLFRLHDTFGLPLDLARDLAEQHGFGVDDAGFEREMTAQRERARKSWTGGVEETPKLTAYAPLAGPERSCFLGYGSLSLEDVRITALLRDGRPVDRLAAGETGELVLDATPFYPEGGGQVGDMGLIAGPHGAARVTGTRNAAPGVIIHSVAMEEGDLETGQKVRADVDGRRRRSAMRNHTGTHLFHAALREVLGTHVKQAGSLVAPDRLRFDFSHFQPIDEPTLATIEDLVNEKILADLPCETDRMALDEAIRAGAMAMFGEKYGSVVRVLRIGDFSFELCGGTHVTNTGQIGVFKILHEKGVSSGVRRVEALTGEGAVRRFQEDAGLVRQVESNLNSGRPELIDGLQKKLASVKSLQKEVERLRLKLAHAGPGGEGGPVEQTATVGAHRVVARRADGLSSSEMRSLADSIKQRIGSGVVILARAEDGKAALLVAVTPDLAGRVHAGHLIRDLAPVVGGKGGGRPDLAEAGGKDPDGLEKALESGLASAREALSALGAAT